MQRTPLYEQHKALGARMVPFGGWEMPVQYTGIIEEHHAVRQRAGLFDISHMGRFVVSGPDAEAFLQALTTADVAAIDVQQSQYGLLCYPHGGIVDDIFIYRLQPDQWLVVVNAGNRQKDWDWFQQHQSGFTVQIEDRSQDWAMLALQGPAAEALLAPAHETADVDLTRLPFHAITTFRLCGADGFISRTGYTGEDGFELFLPTAAVADCWQYLLRLDDAQTVLPCGLGARDSLRFEACLALYGHEIDETINPYEARLGWVVKLHKGDFIGRDALLRIKAEKPARHLVGFEMVGRGVPRSQYPIQQLSGETVGHVTTGMPTPTLGQPLGLGLVPRVLATVGSEFAVLIRQKPVRARVIKTPFYQPRYKK